MKVITAVVTYTAYVPDDMEIDSLKESIEDEIGRSLDSFRATANGYEQEDEREPLFTKEKVLVGANFMIATIK